MEFNSRTRKPMRIILALVFAMSIASGYAQNSPPYLDWGIQLGSPDHEYLLDLELGAGGNLVAIGGLSDSLDLDPGPGTSYAYSNYDLGNFIATYSPAGNLVWGKSILSSGAAYFQQSAVDHQGNIFWTALAVDTLFFVPDSSNAYLPLSVFPYYMVVAKFSLNGNYLWGHVFEGPPASQITEVTTDDAGAVYLAGVVTGPTDLDPGPGIQILSNDSLQRFDFLLKLNASGEFGWLRSWKRGPSFLIREAHFDGIDALCLAGTYVGTPSGDSLDMDPGPGTHYILPSSSTVEDGFVMKIDTAGNFVWAQQLEGPGNFAFRSISATSNQEFLVSGEFTDSMALHGANQSVSLVSNGLEDGFIAKYDLGGNLEWASSYGGTDFDIIYDLVHDPDGRIYAVGIFSNTADYSLGSATGQLTSSDSVDGVFLRLAPNGNLLYAGAIGGPGTDLLTNVVKDGNGEIFVSGAFRFDADLSPDNAQVTYSSLGGLDAFIAHLTEFPLSSPTEAEQSISVFPSPSNGRFRVDWKDAGSVEVAIYDLEGRLRHQEFRIVNGPFSIASDLPSGTYILDLAHQRRRARGKLVILND